jgi:hypothetical protein
VVVALALYWRAIAIRSRSSGVIGWSTFSAASSMSSWTRRTGPVNLLPRGPWSSLTGVAVSLPRSVVSSPENSIGSVASMRPWPTFRAVEVQRRGAALGEPAAVVGELHAQLVLGGRDRTVAGDLEAL